MTALKDAPRSDPEVLIEEARRRQRQRHWVIATLAVVSLIAGLYAGAHGGSPAGGRPTGRGDAAGAPAAVSWQELTAPAGYLGPRASVTSVIDWQGRLFAAGEASGLAPLDCAVSCNPVVWTSVDGRWRSVFANRGSGSLPNAHLIDLGRTLLLWQSQEGNQLWRSSNGRTWKRVKLPGEMPALPMISVASNGTRVVAVLGNKFAGGPDRAYGELNPVWTSIDGVHWHRGRSPRGVSFYEVSATSGGFVATGATGGAGYSKHWFVMRSRNGLSWSMDPADTSLLCCDTAAANHDAVVLESVPHFSKPVVSVRFSYSSAGRSWRQARISGGAPDNVMPTFGTMPDVLAVSGGFLAFDNDNTRIWWSTNGRVWKRLRVTGAPPTGSQPWGVALDGHSLVVIESSYRAADGVPAGATTFWRLRLMP